MRSALKLGFSLGLSLEFKVGFRVLGWDWSFKVGF